MPKGDESLKGELRKQVRYGKENARTGANLAKVLGVNYRSVRLTIRELIADRLPILSSTHPPKGYYIANNYDEVREHLAVLKHRALEDLRRYRDLKLATREILQPCQLGLL